MQSQQVGLVSSSSEEHQQQKGSKEPRACVRSASDLLVRLRGRRVDGKLPFPAPEERPFVYIIYEFRLWKTRWAA